MKKGGEALLAGAWTLAREEHYAEAVAQLEVALELDPERPEVKEALEGLRAEIADRPERRQIEMLMLEAESAVQARELRRAEGLVAAILEVDRDHQGALALLQGIWESREEGVEAGSEGAGEVSAASCGPAAASEEDEELLARIDSLLAGIEEAVERGRGAVAASVAEIVNLLEARDLAGARAALAEARRAFPRTEELDAVEGQIGKLDERLEAGAAGVREALKAGRAREARSRLEGLREVVAKDPRIAELESDLQALDKRQREEREEREQQAAKLRGSIRRALQEGRPDEAQKLLEGLGAQVLGVAERDKLRQEVQGARRSQRRIGELIERAERDAARGDHERALEALEQVLAEETAHTQARKLYRESLAALKDRVGPEAPAAAVKLRIPKAMIAVGLAIVALAVLLWALGRPGSGSQPPPSPPPPGSGSLRVILDSPGLAFVGFELPEGGAQASTLHRFLGLPPGSHVLKICRPADPSCSEPVLRNITVREGENDLRVEVPW